MLDFSELEKTEKPNGSTCEETAVYALLMMLAQAKIIGKEVQNDAVMKAKCKNCGKTYEFRLKGTFYKFKFYQKEVLS